ncbi:hypothetical protein [Nonomuraea sp. NPDC003754]
MAELAFGVRAEQQSLEKIAMPLTAEEVEADPAQQAALVRAEREAGLSEEGRRQLHERDERIQLRSARRRDWECSGLRRFRPGPGNSFYSPGMAATTGTTSRYAAMADRDRDQEIEDLARAADQQGPVPRDKLEQVVGGRWWGPGRFGAALREAVREGVIKRFSDDKYGPADDRRSS